MQSALQCQEIKNEEENYVKATWETTQAIAHSAVQWGHNECQQCVNETKTENHNVDATKAENSDTNMCVNASKTKMSKINKCVDACKNDCDWLKQMWMHPWLNKMHVNASMIH